MTVFKGGTQVKGIWEQGAMSKLDDNGDRRKLHNEEFLNLYRSSNIVRVIKSRSISSAGHIARILTYKNTRIKHIDLNTL